MMGVTISKLSSKYNKYYCISYLQSSYTKARILVCVWVLLFFSAHTRPIYPTYIAGNLYRARIMITTTPI